MLLVCFAGTAFTVSVTIILDSKELPQKGFIVYGTAFIHYIFVRIWQDADFYAQQYTWLKKGGDKMYFETLQESLPQYDELQVWGHCTQVDDYILQLVGLARAGQKVSLYGLEYNPAWKDDASEVGKVCAQPKNYREQVLEMLAVSSPEFLMPFTKLQVGDCSFEKLKGYGRELFSRCEIKGPLMLCAFMAQGFTPHPSLSQHLLEHCRWCEMVLEGQFATLPFGQPPEIVQGQAPTRFHHIPLTERLQVQVGADCSEAIRLSTENGERIIYIERVELCDVWAEMETQFDDPRYREFASEEEITQMKKQCFELLPNVCPKGYYLPRIEHEVMEENASVEIYMTDYLDAPIQYMKNGTLFFMPKPDQRQGRHGGRLHADMLQQPVAGDTVAFDIELLGYNVAYDTYLELSLSDDNADTISIVETDKEEQAGCQ